MTDVSALFTTFLFMVLVVTHWYVLEYEIRLKTTVEPVCRETPNVPMQDNVRVSVPAPDLSIPIGDATALHLSMTSENYLDIRAGTAREDFTVNGGSMAVIIEMHRRYQDAFCPDVVCIHGMKLYLLDCSCVCEPGWTVCTTHTVFSFILNLFLEKKQGSYVRRTHMLRAWRVGR